MKEMSKITDFEKDKEDGKQAINRLRDWSEGDVVVGYEDVHVSGKTGKTYKRDAGGDSGIEAAMEIAKDIDRLTCTDGYDIFVYTARVESVETERASDEEPPLKFAQLSDVTVLKHYSA